MEIENTQKVLIVEDEKIIALDLEDSIKGLGFDVTKSVKNYDEAILSVKEDEPDIILMDINLKNSKDGIEIALEIQKEKNIPIIYLTAFCDDKTINRAIQTNPVGYLIKPFKIDELKSTITLGLFKARQEKSQRRNIIKGYKDLGSNYYYDEHKQNLYYESELIKLTPKEKQLLQLLIDAKGKIVPFDIIEYELWENTHISNSTLRTLIYRLRTKLEYKLIETILQEGCRLI